MAGLAETPTMATEQHLPGCVHSPAPSARLFPSPWLCSESPFQGPCLQQLGTARESHLTDAPTLHVDICKGAGARAGHTGHWLVATVPQRSAPTLPLLWSADLLESGLTLQHLEETKQQVLQLGVSPAEGFSPAWRTEQGEEQVEQVAPGLCSFQHPAPFPSPAVR